jgi:hypothetical protein
MQDKEREVLREHILWLNQRLDETRKTNQDKLVFLKRMQDADDLGFAVTDEVRKIAYQLILNDHHIERDSWQQNN